MTSHIRCGIEQCQNFLYKHTINKNPTVGRICALPVTILDVTLDTVKIPLSLIEHVGKAALYLVASIFKRSCLTNFKGHSKLAGKEILYILPKVILFPIDLIYTLIGNLKDPLKAGSVNKDQGIFGLIITAVPAIIEANKAFCKEREPLQEEDV